MRSLEWIPELSPIESAFADRRRDTARSNADPGAFDAKGETQALLRQFNRKGPCDFDLRKKKPISTSFDNSSRSDL